MSRETTSVGCGRGTKIINKVKVFIPQFERKQFYGSKSHAFKSYPTKEQMNGTTSTML